MSNDYLICKKCSYFGEKCFGNDKLKSEDQCLSFDDKRSFAELGKALNDSLDTVLKDSGNRRKFDSGAVRDMAEGKGRCDLMPLDILSKIAYIKVFDILERFKQDGNPEYLMALLQSVLDTTDNWSCWADMFLELSKHFEAGAKKYGENNWQKGIPTNCYIDSAVRHYLKWQRGDTDEPHDRAFVWNIICCIWTCENKPELNVYKKEN